MNGYKSYKWHDERRKRRRIKEETSLLFQERKAIKRFQSWWSQPSRREVTWEYLVPRYFVGTPGTVFATDEPEENYVTINIPMEVNRRRLLVGLQVCVRLSDAIYSALFGHRPLGISFKNQFRSTICIAGDRGRRIRIGPVPFFREIIKEILCYAIFLIDVHRMSFRSFFLSFFFFIFPFPSFLLFSLSPSLSLDWLMRDYITE